MSAASSPCQSPVRQRCARCGLSLDTASLLLVCEHNLCLHCAAQLLENHGAAGHRVACKVCQAVTEVDTSAATYLESLLSPSTSRRRGPYGSEMSTQLPLAGSLSPFTAAVSVSPALSAPDSPPRSGTGRQRCGQCEEPADLLCSQCQEVFCRRCGTAVHQRGRMARHQLQALSCEAEAAKKATPSPREAPKVQTDRLGEKSRLPSTLQKLMALNQLSRTFYACPEHPQEPLNYFCLQCQSECICAECCLHGRHRGHEVQSVSEAGRGIASEVDDLLEALCSHQESLKSLLGRIQELRLELAQALAEAQQQMQQQMQKAIAEVKKEEAKCLQEADRSFDMAKLCLDEETSIIAMHQQLSRSLESGDVLQALISFVKLQEAMAVPPLDAAHSAQQLKIQQDHFSEKSLILDRALERLNGPAAATAAMPPLLRVSKTSPK